jgi:hypothetical protein
MIIKTELYYMISQSRINTESGIISIHNLFYNEGYIPFYGLLMWIFYLMSSSYLSVLGMAIGGVGLAWVLEIEKDMEKDTNK